MIRILCAVVSLAFLSACAQQMGAQPSYRPLESSSLFEDGKVARHPPHGTVPRAYARENPFLRSGDARRFQEPVETKTFPLAVTMEMLARGRERFNIYCSVCHGETGYGDGMIVQRGFSPPPSLHSERLRSAPLKHFYDVITNGFGSMPSYAVQINRDDRWAVIAYIRALQLSQNAGIDDVPEDKRQQLEEGGGQR